MHCPVVPRALELLSFLAILLSTLSSIQTTSAQSPTPSCWICPVEDIVDFPLTAQNYAVDPIYCEYGEPTWHCLYSPTTGNLVTDNNEGLCPSAAVWNCQTRREIRKANALPHAPHSPSPASREVKPKVMKTRARLGEKRRLQK